MKDHPLAVDGEDYNLQVEVRKVQSCVFSQSSHLHEKRILGFPSTIIYCLIPRPRLQYIKCGSGLGMGLEMNVTPMSTNLLSGDFSGVL